MRLFLTVLSVFSLVCAALAQTAVVAMNVTSADGTIIYTEARGNKSAPSIILAHGIACTAATFDSLWNEASMQKVYMVRFDARGHGRSGKPTDSASYQSARYAQDIQAIITAFGLSMPFFAGWSLGGAITADIASFWPTTLPFSGFIYMAPIPYLPAGTSVLTSFGASTPKMLDATDAATVVSTRINFATFFSIQGANVPFETLTSWSGGALYLTPAIADLVFYRTQNNTSLLQYAKSGFPTLLLHGANDLIVSPTATTSLLKQSFTNLQEHTFSNAGHAVFFDQTDSVASTILSFVAANTAGGTSSNPGYPGYGWPGSGYGWPTGTASGYPGAPTGYPGSGTGYPGYGGWPVGGWH